MFAKPMRNIANQNLTLRPAPRQASLVDPGMIPIADREQLNANWCAI